MLNLRTRLAVIGAAFLALSATPVLAGDSMPAWAYTRDDGPLKERVNHLDKLNVDDWHAAGIRGKGVKVAVLDNGFRGWREQLGKSLPADVKVRTFRYDGNFEGKDSQHGILVGEVVHTIAPEAELIFANWESDDPKTFLAAVQWAREQGANVMTCSIVMPTWSDGEGGGHVHRTLRKLIGNGTQPGDPIFFSCAGNCANRSWAGVFTPNADGYHKWTDTVTANVLSPWDEDKVSLELTWTDPDALYALEVVDPESGKLIPDFTTKDFPDRRSTMARFKPSNSRKYAVRMRQVKGKPGKIHFTSLYSELAESRTAGSIPFPGDGPEVVTVGAIDLSGQRMSFSACGPNSNRPKPDVVAPIPFNSFFRARPFGGTSAATPQAAATAALCRSLHSDWTAAEVRKCLTGAARDLGPKGHDCETGFGMIRLPAPPKPTATSAGSQ